MNVSLHGRIFTLVLRAALVSASLLCALSCSVDASDTGGGSSGASGSGAGVASSSGGSSSSSAGTSAVSPSGGAGASSGGTGSAGAPPGGSNATGGMSTGGSSSTAGAASTGGSSSMAGSGAGGGAPTGSTPSAGCGKTTTLMNGRASIAVGGAMREYILALPTGYDSSRPYRLVFGWHPLGGSASQVANGGYYGLKSKNDQLILVAPEGLPFSGTNLGWGNKNGEDIAFLQAMLDLFRGQLCVDEARIFSTGFSFGGMMSFAAGCSPKGMMRAIAPMAGNSMVSGCESGDRSVAVMGFHGDHDSVVSIEGGRTARDVFVKRNGCSSETMPVTGGWCDGVAANYKPCSCVSYQGCKAGYPVIWCEYNADHMAAPSSGATLWDFFSQF